MSGPGASAPIRIPRGAAPEGDGILLGSGAVRVDVYIDFQCPFCKRFEEGAAARLSRLVRDGVIHLVYHPMTFLDALSTAAYSSRAAAASGCASDGGRFAAYKDALFLNQPPEGGPGLSAHELIELGRMVGLAAAFGASVAGRTYLPWASFVSEAAAARGVSGTPSVFVAGVPVPANAITIAAAVADVARDRVSSDQVSSSIRSATESTTRDAR